MTQKGSVTRVNRLYAHWLDGEWQKIAYPVAVEGPYRTLQSIAEGALKLHALFGSRIAISDVQLSDSVVVVKLFANKEFREYLRVDSGFLTLVAQPRQDLSDVRLATATRGIERAFHQEWTTSLPRISVDVIRRFGETILSTDKLDVARSFRDRSKGPGKIIAAFPQHKELLEGMLHGICHFVKKTGGQSETPVSKPRAYTNFIEDALNNPGICPGDYGALKGVWDQIQIWVPDQSKRLARSSLIKTMEGREPDRNKWSPEWHRIWNTVVHAWNSNVCDTVGAKRASIAPLPNAVVLYRGGISDMAGPFTSEEGILRARISKQYPVFSFDPSTLSWLSVRDAVCKVRKQRAKFQRVLWNQEAKEIKDASAELIDALTPILVTHSSPIVPHWIWLPVSILGLILDQPILHGLALVDQTQALVQTQASKGLVLNTLHGFKRDLITAFSNQTKPYEQ